MTLLTDTKAKLIKPGDKPLNHGGVTGLALHPSSSKGRGKWVLRYVSPVTQRRHNAGLGCYPEFSIDSAVSLLSSNEPLSFVSTENPDSDIQN